MEWDNQEIRDEPRGQDGPGPPPARQLTQPPISGALQTAVQPPSDAMLNQNRLQNLTVGDRRGRSDGGASSQGAVGDSNASSVSNVLHPTLYHSGSGGWYKSETACDEGHFAKMRLASINPKFRHMHEFLWALYQAQAKAKKAMHSSSMRTVSAQVAANATQGDLAAQDALLQANPELRSQMTTAESFSGAVPKTLKGGRAYWRAAFVQLMAMCLESGVPEFFLTLTANEMGWPDMRSACGGVSFGQRPVEATRHYHHRWQMFKSKFLTGMTPIGEIEHMWYRHEEQGRGSLHVHTALWIKRVQTADGSWVSGAKPDAIRGTAPRGPDPTHPEEGLSPEELEWRRFIRNVMHHDCKPGCRWRHGQEIEKCKSGYPRKVWSADELSERVDGEPVRVRLDVPSDRYEYRTELPEDERLSPYIPLWALAWGANMKIQFCTAASFLGYISKYIPKPDL